MAGKEKDETKSEGKKALHGWLNKSMRIKITDGRTLIGTFLCTDKDRNVILGLCQEYLKQSENSSEEPRVLGLAMVPGNHIVSVEIDESHLQRHGDSHTHSEEEGA